MVNNEYFTWLIILHVCLMMPIFSFLISNVFKFNNSDIESLDLTCGSKHTLYLREDITDMEAAAKMFEQEDATLYEIKSDQNMYSYPLSNMFQRAEAKGYTPYCELKLDSVIEFYTTPEQSSNKQELGTQSQFVFRHCSENLKPEVSEVSFSSTASTLCSLSEPLESASAPKNVSPVNIGFEYCQCILPGLRLVQLLLIPELNPCAFILFF